MNRVTSWTWRHIIHYFGLLLAIYFIFFVELDPQNPSISKTLGIAIWMASWWVAEIVPLAITSLLPIVLFPAFGIMHGRDVSSTYFNHVIFLFIGGFLVALAIQKWEFHKRIALRIIHLFGLSPGRILFGMMAATAFLSMWISNTATAMMMVPILLAIATQFDSISTGSNYDKLVVGLLLAIAYSASVGGLATLVGTPPNLSFVRIYQIYFPELTEISFSQWFLFALPISIILFCAVWLVLYRMYIVKSNWSPTAESNTLVNKMISNLGKMSFEEKAVALVFVSMALLWMTRADIHLGQVRIPGWSGFFGHPSYINDGTVAIAMATLLFLIPSRRSESGYIMDWKTAEDIPWAIILLFGGGFALASGFKESGLSLWVGEQLGGLSSVHPIIMVLGICVLVTFLTELTSNTATVETILPVLAGLAVSLDINPLLLMIPATLSSSLAFMLPVATPPNAIIFGTNRIDVVQMVKTGFWLNLIGIVVVTLMCYYWGGWIFGFGVE